MKIRGALCIAILLMSVAAFPASLQADALPSPPAPAGTPALVVDPTVTRADPAIIWDVQARVYRMYTTETWFAHTPEWQSSKVTGPWKYVGEALPALPTWHGALVHDLGTGGRGRKWCVDHVGEHRGRARELLSLSGHGPNSCGPLRSGPETGAL